MSKPKVLIFIDWFLPGYKAGGPVRSVANMLAHLGNELNFLIITTDTDYTETKPYDTVKSDRWTDFDANTKVFYISKKNLNKLYIRDLIQQTDFDTAYINGVYSYFFSILPLSILKPLKKNIIVCARGMLSKQAFARKSLKKTVFLKLAKLKGLYHGVKFHATNDDERADILEIIGKNTLTYTVSNLPRKNEQQAPFTKRKSINELKLVSVARISQEKNTKFALECLRSITKGNIGFDLYGSIYDERYWNECKTVISGLPNNIKISYKGPINSNKVIETFAQYHFAFMPSVGENFGHGLLESMTAGTPVITSTDTPWKNLAAVGAGEDIPLNQPEQFQKTLKEYLQLSQQKYDILSQSAFDFAWQASNTDGSIEIYRKMFSKI